MRGKATRLPDLARLNKNTESRTRMLNRPSAIINKRMLLMIVPEPEPEPESESELEQGCFRENETV